ncbi:YbhN family protein [Streptomyces fagopyri]|uniref:lysylphosphatidylglycerol synthase transmembrane domain-containing protein n=1 Tax=Streptomyces fagopyri TaxID=2662397 RepID=UPI0036A2CF84
MSSPHVAAADSGCSAGTDAGTDADASTSAGTDEEARPEPDPHPRGLRALLRLRRRTVLLVAAVVVVLGSESVVVTPYARRAAGQLAHADFGWLVPALVSEMASMMMFARLQRHALGAGGLRVRLGSAAATVFAGNAVGATLPGGSLVAITYRTRRMRLWGASAVQIGFAHAATGVLSAIALALLAGAGHLLTGDSSRLLFVAVQVGMICGLTGAALALVHHPGALRRPVRALFRLMRRLRRSAAQQTSADRLLDELAAMHPSSSFWWRGLGLAVANWTADFLCLLTVCQAVGARPALSTTLFAYLAGMAAVSAIPLLPAGIGTMDAAVVLTLHHGGVPTSTAAAADLLYRMITPGLVGVAGWALLVRERRRSARSRSAHASGDAARTAAAGSRTTTGTSSPASEEAGSTRRGPRERSHPPRKGQSVP